MKGAETMHWSGTVENAIRTAWQKKEQLEQFQKRLEDILLQDREDVLREVILPGDGKEQMAERLRRYHIPERLRRYHILIAATGPTTWCTELLGASLELIDWKRLAERLYPGLKDKDEEA
jgi:hypothetical protein